ncbi:hypothetical protein GPECTOR_6g875 [Gonium pectorale]|uniref:Uncharacterized protein n=1 Tax=Gonium pectorale TaxID=33097 RepID=A0A150GVP9_GONPE|nr:hypothetical protein GPECTOR_6g875 [Gonium pectorale]|eukprot:KXZ53956.1 hypothetical protein GPECTOR_6g875 [Gonium pectorale]
MATPAAVTAVIRAARPQFNSAADKVAFAVHAVVSVNGFSLRKVGAGVDDVVAAGAASLPAEEGDLHGWNAEAGDAGEGGTYSFLYAPEAGTQKPTLLLVKCLHIDGGQGGGLLLVSMAETASNRLPATRELQVGRFVNSLASGAAGYEMLDDLVGTVQSCLDEALGPQESASAAKPRTAEAATSQESEREPQRGQERRRRDEEEEEERERVLRDERYRPGFPGGPTHGPPGWGPAGIGDDDLMPGALPRPPGLGGLGGVPLGPRGMGGGMHVGPTNPIFADRLRHPRGGPGMGGPGMGPGGGVPGMRWDPINPEGLQGWNPDDFTRDGRAVRDEGFNDIGRPPPGRGPDWDHMFG